ncbi:MAG: CBS domain-containing protein [Candidatus Sumerlaeia bacterium]
MTTVQDILKSKGSAVATVSRDETVLAAAQLMNEQRIGSVVVTDRDGSVCGIFTERDILTRIVAAQRDPAHTAVGEVMTAPVTCCHPDTPLEECRRVMSGNRIRRLPVAGADGRLVGIVTSGDLLAHQLRQQEQTIEHLNQYIFEYK